MKHIYAVELFSLLQYQGVVEIYLVCFADKLIFLFETNEKMVMECELKSQAEV